MGETTLKKVTANTIATYRVTQEKLPEKSYQNFGTIKPSQKKEKCKCKWFFELLMLILNSERKRDFWFKEMRLTFWTYSSERWSKRIFRLPPRPFVAIDIAIKQQSKVNCVHTETTFQIKWYSHWPWVSLSYMLARSQLPSCIIVFVNLFFFFFLSSCNFSAVIFLMCNAIDTGINYVCACVSVWWPKRKNKQTSKLHKAHYHVLNCLNFRHFSFEEVKRKQIQNECCWSFIRTINRCALNTWNCLHWNGKQQLNHYVMLESIHLVGMVGFFLLVSLVLQHACARIFKCEHLSVCLAWLSTNEEKLKAFSYDSLRVCIQCMSLCVCDKSERSNTGNNSGSKRQPIFGFSVNFT